MQRHRRKDRTERAAPTIQKYLQGAVGGLSVSNSTPGPTTNENFYQPCVGGPSGKAGAPVCCRKDEILFQASPMQNPGCYPDNDPDGIEVYKEQHHQQQQHQAGEEQYRGGERCVQQQRFHAKWYPANESQFTGEPGEMVYTRPTEDAPAAVHHHLDHQQQQQHSCEANIQGTGGSTEYSYAYCEPILLQQRPIPTNTINPGSGAAEQQLTNLPAPPNLASSPSSYCVPTYPQQRQLQHHHLAHPHPPPSLQRGSCRQSTTNRNHYQYTTGAGNNTTLTTLHHHHHHHHHHSNFTLPNPTTTTSTSTTGSLRALFSNIFRKSSSSAAPSSSTQSAVPLAPIIDVGGGGGGSGGTLQRSMYGDDAASLLATERHSFTTCYGTKENIYEDIGSQTGLVGVLVGSETAGTHEPLAAGSSCGTPSLSIPPPPPLPPPSGAGSPTGAAASAVATAATGANASTPSTAGLSLADEWRRVQVQHERIIGELNLSVERLIMPSQYDEQDQQQPHQQQAQIQFHCCQDHPVSTEARGAVATLDGKHVPGGIRTSTKRLYAAPTPTSSSSSPPPQLVTSVGGLERHSPTVSYGKSYGDVDSGISSSSTSGTSYSSSILYRSITNYQQQQQQHAGGKEQQSSIFGGGSHQQQQPHQSRAKPNLFNLRSGLADGTSIGGRATAAACCRASRDQSTGALSSMVDAEAALLATGSTTGGGIVPNAPGSDLHAYACPTSATGSYGRPMSRTPYSSTSSHTLTSWCFLSDHNLTDRDAVRTCPHASTIAYQRQQSHQQGTQERNTRSNFWTRFRKLRLPTATGSKLFSSSDRQIEKIDAELHLEDFTGVAMWPEPGPRTPVYHRHQHQFNQQLLLDVPPQQQQHHHHHHPLPSSGSTHHGAGAAGGEGEAARFPQVPHHHHQRPLHHAFDGLEDAKAAKADETGGETGKPSNSLTQPPQQQPPQPQQHRSRSPSSSSSSVASSSRSTSSAVSPSSPTSPGSSTSSCSEVKQSSDGIV